MKLTLIGIACIILTLLIAFDMNSVANTNIGGDDIIHKTDCNSRYCNIEVRIWKYKDKTYFIVTKGNSITMILESK